MTPAPKKRRIGLKRDATQAAAHIGGESHGSYSSEQAKYQNGHIQNDQVPQVIDLQQAAAPARDASKIVRQPRRETACISTETVAHAPGKVSAGDHSRAPRKDMLAGAVSGGSAAPMEVGPPVAERKPKLACLFCRGRKIACGPPETEADGKTCK